MKYKAQQRSFRKQFLKASKAAGLGEALDLGEEKELGGVGWIRPAVMTALRPKVGVDAVSKYANHSSVRGTEGVYDLDKQALDLKGQAVEEARKLLTLDPKPPKASSTPVKPKRTAQVSRIEVPPLTPGFCRFFSA